MESLNEPRSDLHDLDARWLELYEALHADHERGRHLAGLFLSVPPLDYDLTAARNVLYVGKATAGDFYLDDFLAERTGACCRRYVGEFLEEWARTGRYVSAFWRHALKLSEIASRGRAIAPLQNLVWTNLCKIGVKEGNPEGAIYDAQRALAVETLRREVCAYRPALVVFATGQYADRWIGEITDDPDRRRWQREPDEWDCWWRAATATAPAFLFTGHPERKSHEIVDRWLAQAAALLC